MPSKALDKKSAQLGMSAGTASNRLVKDLLWNFIVRCGDCNCCKCGQPMARDTFSIEHLDPWLDSLDPVSMFFDLENIGYSHLSCNIGSARKPNKLSPDELEVKRIAANEKRKLDQRAVYSLERRRAKYSTTGY